MFGSVARFVASRRERSAGRAGRTPGVSTDDDWTCAMHPEVLLSRPGRCPVCDMKLLPLRRRGAAFG